MRWTVGLAVVAALIAALGLVYAPSLPYPFQFDDQLLVRDGNLAAGNWRALLWPPVPRVLTWLTFLAQFQLSADPFWLRLPHLLLHLVNALLLGAIVRRLLGEDSRAAAAAAGLAALLFALHPVQVESVVYVYQRSTLLAAFFALLATWLWLRGPGSGWLPALCYVLGVASKEYVVLLPLSWWLLDGLRGHWRPRRALWPPLLAGGAAVVVLSAWLAFGAEPTLGGSLRDSGRYLITQLTAFWNYCALILTVRPPNVDHHVVPWQPSSLRFWASLTGISLLLAGVYAVRRWRPEATFLGALFFLFLLPTSSLVASPDAMFDHRLYAALAGVAGLAALALRDVLEASSRPLRLAGGALLLMLPVYLGLLSWTRVPAWREPVTLWRDAQAKSPAKYRPNFNLGVLQMERDPAESRRYLSRAARIAPGEPSAHRSLGQLEWEEGSLQRARRHWETALGLDSDHAETHAALGQLLLRQRDFVAAKRHLDRAHQLDPALEAPYLLLARLHLEFGFLEEAIDWAERGLTRHPEQAQLWLLLGQAVYLRANYERAEELFREALRLDPELVARPSRP